MKQLILVNGFFAALLLFFVLMPVTSNWLWLALIFVWCWTEGVIAKSSSVKWWHMLLVFIILGIADVFIIYTFSS